MREVNRGRGRGEMRRGDNGRQAREILGSRGLGCTSLWWRWWFGHVKESTPNLERGSSHPHLEIGDGEENIRSIQGEFSATNFSSINSERSSVYESRLRAMKSDMKSGH